MSTHALEIKKGKTFVQVVRWETTPIVYKPISAITQTAPARITSTAHGIPNGWRVAVVSVRGMTQINAVNSPLKDSDYKKATVIDANTVELNTVNSAAYKPYVGGGYLQYNTPMDLTGYTARMAIKDKVGGTVLATLTTENGGITLDAANYTITLRIDATATAAYTWKKGVYDLELVKAGVVTLVLDGTVTAASEVTT